jgi:uncharacterized membrane protein (UPF0127 family)
MQSNETAKTKSAHKRSWKFVLVMGGLMLLVVAAAAWLLAHPTPTTKLHVGSRTFTLESAETINEQRRGLADRSTIAANEGMLFIFPEQARQCMWMKNMRFPIDIVWLDGDHRIVHIEHAVAPETYPEAFCYEARYVIELRAGQAANANLKQGQRLTF